MSGQVSRGSAGEYQADERKADGFSVAEIVGKGVEGQTIRSLEGMEQH